MVEYEDTHAGEEDGVEAIDHDAMVAALSEVTGTDVASAEPEFTGFMASVQSAVANSDLYAGLIDLHNALVGELVLDKVRAVESWADGTNEFKVVPKSWTSVVDKLYRINIEDNPHGAFPPIVPTVLDQAKKAEPIGQAWITPANAHEVIDDLVRTKFVVPFADGVVDVGDRVSGVLDGCGAMRFRRFHAKDSGYHAQHYYGLVPVDVGNDVPIMVSVEVKILTKMQDLLGEVTHRLYEKQRTGEVPTVKKRKLAWQLGDPAFKATYVGHAGHHLESAICDLKNAILGIDEEN